MGWDPYALEKRVREYLYEARRVSTLPTSHWLGNAQADRLLSKTLSQEFNDEFFKEEKVFLPCKHL